MLSLGELFAYRLNGVGIGDKLDEAHHFFKVPLHPVGTFHFYMWLALRLPGRVIVTTAILSLTAISSTLVIITLLIVTLFARKAQRTVKANHGSIKIGILDNLRGKQRIFLCQTEA